MNDPKTAELPQGRIAYRDGGQGEPIVFVHGFLVDGRLWDGVAGSLEDDFRCIQPDWPMGSHSTAMDPDADLSAPGMARLVSDFLAALDLEGVTLVGNDSGGAISQIVATSHPERIARLVLTNCDTHENFPPAPVGKLPQALKVPGVMTAIAAPLRFARARRIAFAPFAKTGVSDELLAGWSEPSVHDREVRRDARKFAMGMDKRYTLEAAERLASSKLPLLLAWAPEDRFFKLSYAKRLADAVPGARLVEIPDARTFVPLDQPQLVADAIATFMREPAPASAPA